MSRPYYYGNQGGTAENVFSSLRSMFGLRVFYVYCEKESISMNHIQIADTTLCPQGSSYSFKEKLEIARQLEKLHVNIIELPEITGGKTDTLLVRTISSFVKESILSVAAGSTAQSIEDAAAALNSAANARIRIELPLSPVGMEYTAHKKPAAMQRTFNCS